MGERRESPKGEDERAGLAEDLLKYYLEYRSRLTRIRDQTYREAFFIALLNKWFIDKGLGFLVVTGGFAVELLTGTAYRTMDVDIITSNPIVADVLERFLQKIGERIARGYLPVHEEIAVKSIDIVSTGYTRKKKPLKMIIDNVYLFIDPPEELIVSYLAAWKYWDSGIDRDKAIILLATLYDRLDMEYVRSRAIQEKVIDKLDEAIKLIRSAMKRPKSKASQDD